MTHTLKTPNRSLALQRAVAVAIGRPEAAVTDPGLFGNDKI